MDTFEYYEWLDNFPPGVVQPRFKLSDFKTKPREPTPKCPPHVHVGAEDEFAECLHAYGAAYGADCSMRFRLVTRMLDVVDAPMMERSDDSLETDLSDTGSSCPSDMADQGNDWAREESMEERTRRREWQEAMRSLRMTLLHR